MDVLEANTLRLAKEIGEALGVSHAPLMTAIRAKKMHPYVVEFTGDERDIDVRCDYVCQKDLLVHVCSQPVLWRPAETSSKRCPEHLYSKPIPARSLPTLSPTDDSQLFLSEDGTLYDSEFMPRGYRYSAVGKKILFELAE